MTVKAKKETIEAVLENLRKGNGILVSCKNAGISHVTLWRLRKEDPELEEEYQQILDSRTQIVEDALFKNACEGNTTAQIFWLKNRAPERWRDVQDYRHEGNVGLTHQTAEQARQLLKNILPDYVKVLNDESGNESTSKTG